MLERNHFSDIVCRQLHLDGTAPATCGEWNGMLEKVANSRKRVDHRTGRKVCAAA